ncbi:C40 family peptidase [Nafulsella turpanensis]|uniref:C40 family peptidase n=1 Tax=Nafulsella turpanensis TaxID=1265690 RepID=UPI00034B36C0|nr:C40 family peptidase [Nafulsella turpanensis]
MQRFLHFFSSSGRYFNRYKRNSGVALAVVVIFSAFHSNSFDGPPGQSNTHSPPDSLSIIDPLLKETLLNDFRSRQLADSLSSFALSLHGKKYRYGGESPEGFDCSGFVFYVFSHFGHELLRSSRSQSTQGKEIPLNEVQKGDLLFFTGTNPKLRQVGHVGIIISTPEEEISFVHSSSNGGVKVSQLDGYYETRLMFARRILEN